MDKPFRSFDFVDIVLAFTCYDRYLHTWGLSCNMCGILWLVDSKSTVLISYGCQLMIRFGILLQFACWLSRLSPTKMHYYMLWFQIDTSCTICFTKMVLHVTVSITTIPKFQYAHQNKRDLSYSQVHISYHTILPTSYLWWFILGQIPIC